MGAARGNINEDFFLQNSDLTIAPEIKKLLEKEERSVASKIMWAIYLIEDPDSIYFRIPREERIKEVQKEYYNIKLEAHKPLVDEYCRFVLSKEQAMLKFYFDAMDSLVTELRTRSDINNKIKILSNIPKIWEGLEKIQTRIKEDNSKTQIKGHAKEGAREKREREQKGNQQGEKG